MKPEKYTVLYVDDEESNLRIFKAAFRRYYNVITANSAKEGMEVLKNNPVQVVITDQKMPQMNGVEFLSEILPLYPDTIRMILTGFSDVEAIINSINKGRVTRYVTKPWETDELKSIIDQSLDEYQKMMDQRDRLYFLEQRLKDLGLE